jgi:hypothetical protein
VLSKELNPYGYSSHPIHFSDVEIDQARAAGVLIEFEHGSPIITDRKLYRELVKQALARSVEEYRDNAAAAREANKGERKGAGAKPADRGQAHPPRSHPRARRPGARCPPRPRRRADQRLLAGGPQRHRRRAVLRPMQRSA